MLIDTHCHMNIMTRKFDTKEPFQPFTNDEFIQLQNIIADAQKESVTTIINVGTNYIESIACIQIAQLFENCYATIGLHPNDSDDNWQKTIELFKILLETKEDPSLLFELRRGGQARIVGIGECGIDKHYPDFNLRQQQDVFHAQIQLALEHDLALVIHSRDADQETYDVLAQYRGEKNFRGTIHCFSSDERYAQKYLDLGFVLGFGGTVTYPKNETLRNVVTMIPLEKIILETDAPFLPPQSLRGKPNHPAYIKIIAQYIAQLRGESFETVMETTAKTTQKLFGIIAS